MKWICKKKVAGSNLLDYVIPVAVFGVVFGIAIYNLHSTGLLQKFFRASTGGSLKGKSIILNTNNDFSPGFLNGTPTDPKMQCSSHSCAIDFGTYVLTGIPAESIDASTAGRGGELTTSYANVLEQIARQFADTDPQLANILKQMAEKGKEMASDETKCEMTQRKIVEAGFNYDDKVKDGTINLTSTLKTLNVANFDPEEDPYTIIATMGNSINKGKLFNYIYGADTSEATKLLGAAYSILESGKNLQSWQKSFIQQLASFNYASDAKYLTREQMDSLYSIVGSNMTTSKAQQLKGKYNRSSDNSPNNAANIDNNKNLLTSFRTTGNGSGKQFKDLYTKELPKVNLDPSIKAIVDFASNQIMTIADNTFTINITREEFKNSSSRQNIINSQVRGEIITEVAPALVNEANKIEESNG